MNQLKLWPSMERYHEYDNCKKAWVGQLLELTKMRNPLFVADSEKELLAMMDSYEIDYYTTGR